MSTPTITQESLYSKGLGKRHFILMTIVAIILFTPQVRGEWKVDLSRRQKAVRQNDMNSERKGEAQEAEKGVFDILFDAGEPLQEIVVLNTEKGFVPNTVRLRKGAKYVVHVVNVNEKEKNVSFVLDAFSEHHATYYGKIKTFRLEPKKEGVFSFQSPETSFEGRVVVYNPQGTSIRAPASEEP